MVNFKIELTFACPIKSCSHQKDKETCGEKMKADFDLEQGWTTRQSCEEEPSLEDILEALIDKFKCWSEKERKE